MNIIYTLLLIFLVVVGFVLLSALIYNIVSRLVKTEQFLNNYFDPGNSCVKQCVSSCNIGSNQLQPPAAAPVAQPPMQQPQQPQQPQPQPQPQPQAQDMMQTTSTENPEQFYPNNNYDVTGMKEELTYNKRLGRTYYDKFEELKNNDRFSDNYPNDPSCREFRTSQATKGNISDIPYSRTCW
ncbi:MAG: hypothetical protein Harvfovirus11_25 [Harvfovirus sp.]|uniref:Uncharacterized protein n=1 Tax=Harvfovirus sp. TaxID=2487768 RepID=A0A3G5A568_9VIRU|nr:MAG: hypothetical protein Harvfovirus11_25 [Harvfovirus sp.]